MDSFQLRERLDFISERIPKPTVDSLKKIVNLEDFIEMAQMIKSHYGSDSALAFLSVAGMDAPLERIKYVVDILDFPYRTDVYEHLPELVELEDELICAASIASGVSDDFGIHFARNADRTLDNVLIASILKDKDPELASLGLEYAKDIIDNSDINFFRRVIRDKRNAFSQSLVENTPDYLKLKGQAWLEDLIGATFSLEPAMAADFVDNALDYRFGSDVLNEIGILSKKIRSHEAKDLPKISRDLNPSLKFMKKINALRSGNIKYHVFKDQDKFKSGRINQYEFWKYLDKHHSKLNDSDFLLKTDAMLKETSVDRLVTNIKVAESVSSFGGTPTLEFFKKTFDPNISDELYERLSRLTYDLRHNNMEHQLNNVECFNVLAKMFDESDLPFIEEMIGHSAKNTKARYLMLGSNIINIFDKDMFKHLFTKVKKYGNYKAERWQYPEWKFPIKNIFDAAIDLSEEDCPEWAIEDMFGVVDLMSDYDKSLAGRFVRSAPHFYKKGIGQLRLAYQWFRNIGDYSLGAARALASKAKEYDELGVFEKMAYAVYEKAKLDKEVASSFAGYALDNIKEMNGHVESAFHHYNALPPKIANEFFAKVKEVTDLGNLVLFSDLIQNASSTSICLTNRILYAGDYAAISENNEFDTVTVAVNDLVKKDWRLAGALWEAAHYKTELGFDELYELCKSDKKKAWDEMWDYGDVRVWKETRAPFS